MPHHRLRPLLLAFVITTPGVAQDAPPAAASVDRPKYTFLRQNEDWSVLGSATPETLSDPWDRLKHLDLGDGNWLSFGGQGRLRLEDFSNFGFGPGNDDTYLLWRFLLHADLHLGENLRLFTQGKTAGATERELPGGRRALDADSLDLEQLFLDVVIPLDADATLTLRPGRQAFSFGKQRLVSPLPWANTLRRWDGLSGVLKAGGWTYTGFASQFVPVRKYEFNDAESDIEFAGLYATGPWAGTDTSVDLYYLYLSREQATFNGTSGREERHTLGGRLAGALPAPGLTYDVEGAYQLGEVGAGDIDAWMVGARLTYALPDVGGAPAVYLGIEHGSGDRTPGGDVETFNHLFPLGHAYFGYIDAIGRQNAVDLLAGVSLTPAAGWKADLSGHLFWRPSDEDALYNAGGGVLRPGGAGTDEEIGAEIDLTVKYRFDRHLAALVGYSHFFAGDFIEQTGPSDDIDFVYVQLEYTF
ncbi:MAG: alginate export family protein [Phycisphaerales bacterium]|nr:alginate export family protein [Phycisphaerae bacterium]NNF42169.1 alginate export family protein [Phycisphaerales bacterium]NNM27867.1 alginate export family protein [Phycisphaerales bacterium]